MAKPVQFRIVDMPDKTFAIIAVLASGKSFRRVGLSTLAGVDESVASLRDIMAASGSRSRRSGAGDRGPRALAVAPERTACGSPERGPKSAR